MWASEIDSFPIKVTNARLPQLIHVGDITKLRGDELPPVDIVTGGSPCQDLSVAGKRAGLAGERSGLFMEQIRVIKEMRCADEKRKQAAGSTDSVWISPRYMVWENVPGAFSSAKGEDFRAVIEETCRIADGSLSIPRPPAGRWESAGAVLGEGFSVAWRVLDAQYWGVPQRRKRIFLVADFGGTSAPKILFEQDRLLGDTSPVEGARQRVATGAAGGFENSGGTGYLDLDNRINKPSPVICLNDQGGERMCVSKDQTGTLRSQMDGHPPLVLASQQGGAEIGSDLCPTITASAGMNGKTQPVLYENHGIDSRYTGPCAVAPTMSAAYGTGGNNIPLLGMPRAFSLDSKDSNSMKSDNPHSGCRETDVSRTIDTTNPDPSKNQGGIAILQEITCIAGNIIDRNPKNGGNGLGCQSDISYTLTGADRHAVCIPYQDVIGALCHGDEKGISNQYVEQGKCIMNPQKLIRRLTPLECERLQGFPDGWTALDGAADSPRYKALGNSVAIPCVDFVLRGIALITRQ